MKITVTALALALGASGAAAENIYHGFGVNNADLYEGYVIRDANVRATPPGVSDSFDRYHGFAKHNPDILSRVDAPRSENRSDYRSPDRYGGFDDGNPDLM